MKRLFRHACAMLAVLIVMSMFTVVNASAANGTTIDTTNAKYGFVTVNYTSNAKLKVGIQYGNEKTSYKNCPSGKDAVFSLEQGDGTYTIKDVTGDLVITIEKKTTLTMEVAVSEYVQMDNKTVFLVTVTGTPEEGKAFVVFRVENNEEVEKLLRDNGINVL